MTEIFMHSKLAVSMLYAILRRLNKRHLRPRNQG
jgi:hypothetical protein